MLFQNCFYHLKTLKKAVIKRKRFSKMNQNILTNRNLLLKKQNIHIDY